MSFHLSFLKSRFVQKSISLALFSLSAFLILSFYSYNADDPSFSTANSQIVDPFIHNLMGWPGALLSDVMLQYIGFACDIKRGGRIAQILIYCTYNKKD